MSYRMNIKRPKNAKRRSLGSHHSSAMKSDAWLTPKYITDALGTFNTDPCIPRDLPIPMRVAFQCYDISQDGLKKSWAGRVWLNPPFGSQWPKWVSKLAAHGNGIVLIPARTETAAFFEHVWGKADGILFMKGRPHFIAGVPMMLERKNKPEIFLNVGDPAPFNSGAPICLVAFGKNNVTALQKSGLGYMVALNPFNRP